MNTVNFNELFNKVKHELVRFEYRNRFLNSYTFKRDDMIFTLDFDKLLNIQIYSKVFNSEGVAVDLKYFYNSSYKLTTLQTKQVKKFIESLIK